MHGGRLKDVYDYDRDLIKASKKPKKSLIITNEHTYLGKSGKRKISINNNAKHIYICGTTGSGKTVAISNFIQSIVQYDYPSLIIDGKGDTGNGSILDIINILKQHRKVYVINMNDPTNSDKYNPFYNTTPTIIKDMLINLTEWSEEHYQLNAERYIQKLLTLMKQNNIHVSFRSILSYFRMDKFSELSVTLQKEKKITKEEHLENINILETSGKIVASSLSRFSTLLESDIGCIFDENGIDISTALKENAIIVFILNPLTYPLLSSSLGKLAIIDGKKAVSHRFNYQPKQSFFIFDELNVYASKSFLNLVNKSRSANVTCVLATQSLSDLESAEDTSFKEQIIENCNNYIVMRQNSAVNAEQWANIIGTQETMTATYQVTDTGSTGLGTIRPTREFIYHPDDIKSLKMGEAIFVSKENMTSYFIKVNKPF